MKLAVLALDDYLLAAAEQRENWQSWSYWYIPDPSAGDEYVIYEVERDVPKTVADKLLAHGTREQEYSDGYEAMDEAQKYGLKEYDRWVVEGDDLEDDDYDDYEDDEYEDEED